MRISWKSSDFFFASDNSLLPRSLHGWWWRHLFVHPEMQLSGDTTGEAYFTHLHLQRFKVDCRDKSIDGAENQTPCEFCFADGFFGCSFESFCVHTTFTHPLTISKFAIQKAFFVHVAKLSPLHADEQFFYGIWISIDRINSHFSIRHCTNSFNHW